MPEQDFELYLSLLTRFLRLQPRQRAEIADELRDHLELRLQELTATGVPREAAIRQALEELGDASLLASDFTSIRVSLRRRSLMRWTVRSIAGLTAAVLLTFALWPVQNQLAPAPATAQPTSGVGSSLPPMPGGGPMPGAGLAPMQDAQAVTEGKLAQLMPKLELEQVPLNDALDLIAEKTATDIVLVRPYIEDLGIDTSNPISIRIRNTPITARTALDLILRPMKLGYTIRDGIIFVGSPDDATDVQVYNCRDLLPATAWDHTQGQGGTGMPGTGSMAPPGGAPAALPGDGMMMPSGMGGFGGMGGPVRPSASSSEGESLISTITATVAAPTWSDAGGQGAITEFKGLLVIKQTQAIHREVRQLLEKIREAGNDGTGAPPPGFGDASGGVTPGTPGATPAIPGTREPR